MKKMWFIMTVCLLFLNCGSSKNKENSVGINKAGNSQEANPVIVENELWVVSAEGLNLRDKPGTDGNVIALIPDGTKINLIEEADGETIIQGVAGRWTKVGWGELQGWVLAASFPEHLFLPGNYSRALFLKSTVWTTVI